MLTRNTIKWVKSLQQKKYRRETGLFFVEGAKSVKEALRSDFVVEQVFATHEFLPELAELLTQRGLDATQATQAQLVEMGSFESNDAALAVLKMRDNHPLPRHMGEYLLALDDIRDPGNLGTIIRTADWYGIRQIVCSPETADVYNPKVIHATMGSFSRVNLFYTDLAEFLKNEPTCYGAVLGGANIHSIGFEHRGGVIVIGNESNGIHRDLLPLIEHKITIPRFGAAESLNAGIATAVILDNLARHLMR